MNELRILSPTAILGYGFPLASFQAGLDRDPHAIAVDAGSTDPGPYYLGSGQSFTQRSAVKRDLRYLIEAAMERKIPLIIGTAGGSGAKAHVGWTLAIIQEIRSSRPVDGGGYLGRDLCCSAIGFRAHYGGFGAGSADHFGRPGL